MNTHDFPRAPWCYKLIRGIVLMCRTKHIFYNVLFHCFLYIYYFLFFIFLFFTKHPYLKFVKKVYFRAKLNFTLVTHCFSLCYLCTILARFRHDLYFLTVHSFFWQLYKIVRKIVRLVRSVFQLIKCILFSLCTKAHSFCSIQQGGVVNTCRFFMNPIQISCAYV